MYCKMALAYFSMLVHELLNKYPDIVTEEYHLFILDSKSAVYMANNGKYINHTRNVARIINSASNGEK